jgi:hypothetical protein
MVRYGALTIINNDYFVQLYIYIHIFVHTILNLSMGMKNIIMHSLNSLYTVQNEQYRKIYI